MPSYSAHVEKPARAEVNTCSQQHNLKVYDLLISSGAYGHEFNGGRGCLIIRLNPKREISKASRGTRNNVIVVWHHNAR